MNSIKSIIPDSIKFPLWWLFKSPQRDFGWYTLFNDLKGLIFFVFRKLFPPQKLKPISICTGIYNRSDNYLSHFIKSVNKMENADLIELSVFDCGSNDIENFQQKIKEKWNGKLIFNDEKIKFSRAYTFNKAVEQCSNEMIFICDADMILPLNFVQLCNSFIGKKRVWYPIYFFQFENKSSVVASKNGVWEKYGSKGMFGALKSDFKKVGKLNEKYTEWGFEDTELWQRFHQSNFVVIRNKQKDFFHHWHETFNPKYQKKVNSLNIIMTSKYK